MTIFVVVLQAPNTGVVANLESKFPRFFKYSDSVFLLESDTIAEDVAVKLGIKGDNRIKDALGFVLKLNSFNYDGFTTRSLWDWLSDAQTRT